MEAGLQVDVLQQQVRPLQAPDGVLEVGVERRQLVEIEPGLARIVRRPGLGRSGFSFASSSASSASATAS